MAIFRGNKCAYLQEQPDTMVGRTIACVKCENPASVYNTLAFVGKLLEKYFESQRAIAGLKSPTADNPATQVSVSAVGTPSDDIDLFNTDHFASELQHGPIYDWFNRKQIKVLANGRSVDTTGFFDEVATGIGSNLPVLKEVLERIRWAQQKEYASTTIHLEKKTPEAASAISDFCQQLYDYSFVAKCFHNRHEQNIRLILQAAPAIRHFFNGEWLEWHALMRCLQYAKTRNKRFSCARGLKIVLQNDESYELDVFILIDGKLPVCIECKTGEYRQNIDKYLTLRKRLGLGSKDCIMCIAELSEEQAKGLTAMYDLTFTSERGLVSQLAKIF